MQRWIHAILLLVALLPIPIGSAGAQLDRAAVGAGIGAAGGAVITLSLVVARARWHGEFIESADDLIHWQTAPMLITPAVGAAFGWAGRETLIQSVVGSSVGMIAGATAGAAAGWLLSESAEWPWAGAVMGAGLGMTVGGLVMGIREYARRDDGEPAMSVRPANLAVRLTI